MNHEKPAPRGRSTLMKYRLVIFDFDGTLADTFGWFGGAINELAERHGFKRVEPGEQEMLRAWDARAIMKRLRVPLWKVPRIAADMRALMNRDIGGIAPFAGAVQALERLSGQGALLGLVTSNAEKNAGRILGAEPMGLFSYREHGVSLFGKAGRLRSILRKSRIPPARALYIGDELRDCAAARSVGVRFGAVAWGYNSLEALQEQAPDELLLRMEDIAGVLS